MQFSRIFSRCFLPCLLLALTACAPLPAHKNEVAAGRARLVLPPGQWEDLGAVDQALPLLPAPPGRIPLQTRTLGLRGADQALLALLRVQTNEDNFWPRSVYWPGHCPQQKGVLVQDATQGSPVRIDCLRLKRWASHEQWLDKHQPELAQWLGERKLSLRAPYSYVSYRYATEGGASVAVQAVIDQRLLQPQTRNNAQFLVAGRPALQWGQDLAQAVRVSVGMMDGYLAIPPFPYPLAGKTTEQ